MTARAQVAHLTDGVASPGEWPTPTSSQASFPYDPGTGAGGAYLYADQGSATGGSPGQAFGTNLYLLYDYVNATYSPTSSMFFDVFFQVTSENQDYLVRIMGTSFTAFEKPTSTPAPTPGGSFDPTSSPWTPLTSADLALAGFVGAIGFGTSPNGDPIMQPSVPEPSSAILAAVGALGALGFHLIAGRRRGKSGNR